MGDPAKGIYEKFKVERTDGKSEPGEKHYFCKYFVLDLKHDKHARAALMAYAESCKKTYPLLSQDLFKIADEMLDNDCCHFQE
jgi:hypothetical protein